MTGPFRLRLRELVDTLDLGGEGSGNFDHAGRPGEVGGSAPSSGAARLPVEVPADYFIAKVMGGMRPDPALAVKRIPRGDRFDVAVMTKVEQNADRVALAGKNIGAEVERTKVQDTYAVLVKGLPGWATPEESRQRKEAIAKREAEMRQKVAPVEDAQAEPEDPAFRARQERIATSRFKSRQERNAAGRRARLASGGEEMYKQQQKDWKMARGRETQRIIRAIRKREQETKLSFTDALNAILLGGEGSGNFGHSGRPGEVGGSSSDGGVPTGKAVQTTMAPTLASAAQAVYDEWDENVDEYGGGGICHIIAEEMAGKLIDKGIEATTVSAQIGDQHVWVVAKLADGVYSIDIPPGTYETGGGYTWKKRQGVEITKDDVIVDRIDSDPSTFEDYLDMSFQLGGEGSGNFGHAGRPGEVGGSASEGWSDVERLRVNSAGGVYAPDAKNARILFHGTVTQNIASIREHGLKAKGGAGAEAGRLQHPGGDAVVAKFQIGDRVQSVFMAFDVDKAKYYAELAQEANPGSESVVLAVRIPGGVVAEYDEFDRDALRYMQTIPPEWIRVVNPDGSLHALADDPHDGITVYLAFLVDGVEGVHLADRKQQLLDLFVEALNLGSDKSGNYGHAGRPGQVGGSASGSAAGTHIATKSEQTERGHYLQEASHHIAPSELTPELEEAFNWAVENPATPILTMDSTVTFRPLGKTPLRWTASNGVEIVKAFDAGGSFHDYNPKNEMAVPLNVEKPRSEYGDADSQYAEMDEEDYQRENKGRHSREAATMALEEWSRKFVIPIAQARFEAKRARGLSNDPATAFLLGGEGSGNFGHSGRPGEVGGSGPGATDSPAFKQWFGKSKVVNEQGRPLRVYHATKQDFDQFATVAAPNREVFDPEMGAHFGTQEQVDSIAGLEHSRVLPVYLSIENPVRVKDHGDFHAGEVASQLFEQGILTEDEAGPVLSYWARERLFGRGRGKNPVLSVSEQTQHLQKTLQAKGYDGIVYLNRREGYGESADTWAAAVFSQRVSDEEWKRDHPEGRDSWIAFKPEQIKSAIGNKGTYDKTNPSIAASSHYHLYGTDKSGNYGHAGRPGQVGGSAPGDGGTTEARKYERDEGFAIFESPEMEAYVKGLPPKDIDAIDSYGGFTYGDINGLLRGTFTPRIVDEVVRDATPEEAASWKASFGRSHDSDYPEDDPTNKVEDGRIVRNWYYEGGYKPEGGNVQIENFVIEKAGPDLKRVKELGETTDTINEHIRERGHVLEEAVVVNRAAYIPGMSYDDLKALEGETIEEKGFTSTMVGDPNGRLNSYVMHGKTESIYKRFGNLDMEHQREVGAPMRIEVVLPEGTKVAAVEATRRATVDYERVPDPEAYEDYKKRYPADTDLKPEHFTKPDRTKPTIKTNNLHKTDQRKEAEFLLGSGAKFRVVSVNKAAKPISWPGDGSILPIDVIDVKLEYIGGGSSEASKKHDLRFLMLGGEGSGNFGHAGRKGEVGGSAKGDYEPEYSSAGLERDITGDDTHAQFVPLGRTYDINQIGNRRFLFNPKSGKVVLGEQNADDYRPASHEGSGSEGIEPENSHAEAFANAYSDTPENYDDYSFRGAIYQPGHMSRQDEIEIQVWTTPGGDPAEQYDAAVEMAEHFLRNGASLDTLLEGSGFPKKSIREHFPFLDTKIAASDRATLRAFYLFQLGGEGSGNFGHAGRIGEVGGSAPSKADPALVAKAAKVYTDSMAGATKIADESRLIITGIPIPTAEEIARVRETDKVSAAIWGEKVKPETDAQIRARLAASYEKRLAKAERSRPLVDAIRQVPESTVPLYRAVGVLRPYTINGKTHGGREMEQFDKLKPGDPVSLDRVTSFSESADVAVQFAATRESIRSGIFDPSGDMHPDDADDYANYQFVIEGEHKSLDVSAGSRYGEKERLTHGKFEVVKVEGTTPHHFEVSRETATGTETKTVGVTYRRTITLRQIATY